jgi:hypothetical protein
MIGLLKGRVRHLTYISCDPADREEAQAFVDYFDHVRAVLLYRPEEVESDDMITGSDDTEYILRRIRELYLADSTVTLVLIGKCTWARRSVDWEIQASLLRQRGTPNGLFGIVLPSAGSSVTLPLRLQMNLASGYAHIYPYTLRVGTLAGYIRTAFLARTASQAAEVVNPPERRTDDAPCP